MSFAACHVHAYPVEGCSGCMALRGRLTGIEREALDTIRERNANNPADRLPLHHWDELMRDLDADVVGEVD